MTQDDAHRGDPGSPPPSPGGEHQRQPDRPPLPSYGTPGSTAAGQGSTAAGQGAGAAGPQAHGMQPGYGPPPGYGSQPAYGPPGYGPPPGYGAPGYGPPPGYGYYPRPTNTLAILALVMAFVFAPAGLVLGVVARKQIRQTGEEGDGLALAGIIVGAIACALVALVIVLWFVAVAALAGVSFGP
jgi:hypothetical protein